MTLTSLRSGMTNHRPWVLLLLLTLGCTAGTACSKEGGGSAAEEAVGRTGESGVAPTPYPQAFSQMASWDDGLSEMSYYDAVDTIYGQARHYFRMMLLNREWLNSVERVKAEHPVLGAHGTSAAASPASIPVLKLNIIEEIPTQNYNYRYMITVFLNRGSLEPEKLAASSQEWCGTTFKEFQWLPDGLKLRGFSYFEGEGDRQWSLPPRPVAYPVEALFVVARAAVASKQDLTLRVLPPARSTHLAEPILRDVRLEVAKETRSVRVPFGRFAARRVTAVGEGEQGQAEFTVEDAPPYRLLAYHGPGGLKLSLRYQERRAYWDRSKPSRFYRQGAAP